LLTGAGLLCRFCTASANLSDSAVKAPESRALTFYLPCPAGRKSAHILWMNSLFLPFLLLGATAGGPSTDAPRSQSRVQATASARILRGEAIIFGMAAGRPRTEATLGNDHIYRLAPLRTSGEMNGADGRLIRLQEFH
jgi:hypothetical protein